MIMLVAGQTGDLRPDAALEGVLNWSAGGCLTLTGMDGEYLLLMPTGTALDGEHTIILDDGSQAAIGESVGWGGGFYSSRDQASDDLVEGLKHVPADCVTAEIAIVNPQS